MFENILPDLPENLAQMSSEDQLDIFLDTASKNPKLQEQIDSSSYEELMSLFDNFISEATAPQEPDDGLYDLLASMNLIDAQPEIKPIVHKPRRKPVPVAECTDFDIQLSDIDKKYATERLEYITEQEIHDEPLSYIWLSCDFRDAGFKKYIHSWLFSLDKDFDEPIRYLDELQELIDLDNNYLRANNQRAIFLCNRVDSSNLPGLSNKIPEKKAGTVVSEVLDTIVPSPTKLQTALDTPIPISASESSAQSELEVPDMQPEIDLDSIPDTSDDTSLELISDDSLYDINSPADIGSLLMSASGTADSDEDLYSDSNSDEDSDEDLYTDNDSDEDSDEEDYADTGEDDSSDEILYSDSNSDEDFDEENYIEQDTDAILDEDFFTNPDEEDGSDEEFVEEQGTDEDSDENLYADNSLDEDSAEEQALEQGTDEDSDDDFFDNSDDEDTSDADFFADSDDDNDSDEEYPEETEDTGTSDEAFFGQDDEEDTSDEELDEQDEDFDAESEEFFVSDDNSDEEWGTDDTSDEEDAFFGLDDSSDEDDYELEPGNNFEDEDFFNSDDDEELEPGNNYSDDDFFADSDDDEELEPGNNYSDDDDFFGSDDEDVSDDASLAEFLGISDHDAELYADLDDNDPYSPENAIAHLDDMLASAPAVPLTKNEEAANTVLDIYNKLHSAPSAFKKLLGGVFEED